MRRRRALLGGTGLWPVGFGVPPKPGRRRQWRLSCSDVQATATLPSGFRRDAEINPRDAGATPFRVPHAALHR